MNGVLSDKEQKVYDFLRGRIGQETPSNDDIALACFGSLWMTRKLWKVFNGLEQAGLMRIHGTRGTRAFVFTDGAQTVPRMAVKRRAENYKGVVEKWREGFEADSKAQIERARAAGMPERANHDAFIEATTQRGCLWIDGDPKLAGYTVCGAPRHGKSVYCRDHYAQSIRHDDGAVHTPDDGLDDADDDVLIGGM